MTNAASGIYRPWNSDWHVWHKHSVISEQRHISSENQFKWALLDQFNLVILTQLSETCQQQHSISDQCSSASTAKPLHQHTTVCLCHVRFIQSPWLTLQATIVSPNLCCKGFSHEAGHDSLTALPAEQSQQVSTTCFLQWNCNQLKCHSLASESVCHN